MRFLTVILCFLAIPSLSQLRQQPDAARILHKMQKLNFLGSVLYVAAHPDDENTRIITHLANGEKAATAYLSLTRGDGGQNLIGTEIRDELGLIRTQELLAARRIDGGYQYFTRAIDFGYSKSAEETFQIWGRDEILHDVVKVYRTFKPDVVLTRFPADERAGHGQHTASAVLASEAFDAAAKPDVFPAQAKQLGIWQPKRLYTNTGRWWDTSTSEDSPGIVSVDVGEYNTLLGKSYSEIAALSRSQHKSQGFGSSGSRGEQLELFEYVKGDKSEVDLFEGINTSWTRVKGGERVEPLVEKAIAEFDVINPSRSVPALLEIHDEIAKLEDSVWKNRKLNEVNELIGDCLGLYCAVSSDQYWIAPGDPVMLSFEVVMRNPGELIFTGISSKDVGVDSAFHQELSVNKLVEMTVKRTVPLNTSYSDPYWLKEPHGLGTFAVQDQEMIGRPDSPPAFSFVFTFRVNERIYTISRPVLFQWTDPVKGEQYRPVEVVPPVTLTLSNEVMIFNNEESRPVQVTVHSNSEKLLKGNLEFQLPAGWKVEPSGIEFELKSKGGEEKFMVNVSPSARESTGLLKASALVNGKSYTKSSRSISYDHFPEQMYMPSAEAKIVRLNIQTRGDLVGYIRGAGDEIPTALRNLGYEVWEMSDSEVTLENLAKTDAVVLGIRALNTNENIGYIMKDLLAYVEQGGTLIVQYNTSQRLMTDDFSPFPIRLSRGRVAEEDAVVEVVSPDHPVMNTPNKITPADFDHWVQERGLYFPDQWDKAFVPILSMHDDGEDDLRGSLLIAPFGKGYYVYTGLSFFRELPEAVPGAYRLFANLVSLGQAEVTSPASSRQKKSTRN